ncbi:uncharacterized protein RJT21DRAFT_1569 [Scheffersomyces amazonensis]|uniref:uncharacterized protein n=1 Tax=Scheffersomyces amazonensis TaxID=1078765 RepID=UPI00315CE0AA
MSTYKTEGTDNTHNRQSKTINVLRFISGAIILSCIIIFTSDRWSLRPFLDQNKNLCSGQVLTSDFTNTVAIEGFSLLNSEIAWETIEKRDVTDSDTHSTFSDLTHTDGDDENPLQVTSTLPSTESTPTPSTSFTPSIPNNDATVDQASPSSPIVDQVSSSSPVDTSAQTSSSLPPPSAAIEETSKPTTTSTTPLADTETEVPVTNTLTSSQGNDGPQTYIVTSTSISTITSAPTSGAGEGGSNNGSGGGGGLSRNNKIIIGVVVGVGSAVLIGIGSLLWYYYSKKKKNGYGSGWKYGSNEKYNDILNTDLGVRDRVNQGANF